MQQGIAVKANKFELEKTNKSMERFALNESLKELYNKVVPAVVTVQNQMAMQKDEHQQMKEILA